MVPRANTWQGEEQQLMNEKGIKSKHYSLKNLKK